MHVELQFDQCWIDRIIDLIGALYTRDHHFTSMKTAKVDSVDFEIESRKQFWFVEVALSMANACKSSPELRVWLVETVISLTSLRRTGNPSV